MTPFFHPICIFALWQFYASGDGITAVDFRLPWKATTRGLTHDSSLVMIVSDAGWSHVHNPMSNGLCVKMVYSGWYLPSADGMCEEREMGQCKYMIWCIKKVITYVCFIGVFLTSFQSSNQTVFIEQFKVLKHIKCCRSNAHKVQKYSKNNRKIKTHHH